MKTSKLAARMLTAYRGNDPVIRSRWGNLYRRVEAEPRREGKEERACNRTSFPLRSNTYARKRAATDLYLCSGELVPYPKRRKRPLGPRPSSYWSQVLTAALVPVYLQHQSRELSEIGGGQVRDRYETGTRQVRDSLRATFIISTDGW